jgi:hypothetical protein
VSLASSGLSAVGRLLGLALLLATFLFGMATVVYMSLQGSEIKVPEITGKDYVQSEEELASLGLKIKRRADRFSTEKPNTIVEQLPKPGEIVKTGQMILVVVSKGPGEGDERPPTLKNPNEEDDAEKIEEMISDKPKKAKPNANARKKADTARDVGDNSNKANSNSDSEGNSNKKDGDKGEPSDKAKPGTPAGNTKPAGPTKPPGDGKPRATPKP